MLIHAGYSAFESLSYEKALDPSAELQIPLDVCLSSAVTDVTADSVRDGGGRCVTLLGCCV